MDSDSADALALAAAVLWLGGVMALALGSDVSLLTALARGLVGAIFVYAGVFVGVHVLYAAFRRTAAGGKRVPKSEERPAAQRPESSTRQG